MVINFKLERRRKKEQSVYSSLGTWWLGSSPEHAMVLAAGGEQGSPSPDTCLTREGLPKKAPPSKLALLTSSACGNAGGFYLFGKKHNGVVPSPVNLRADWDRGGVGDVLAKGFIDCLASYCPVKHCGSDSNQPWCLQLLIQLLVITAWSLQPSQPSHTNPLGLTVQDEQRPFLSLGKGTRRRSSKWRRLCLRILKCY